LRVPFCTGTGSAHRPLQEARCPSRSRSRARPADEHAPRHPVHPRAGSGGVPGCPPRAAATGGCALRFNP